MTDKEREERWEAVADALLPLAEALVRRLNDVRKGRAYIGLISTQDPQAVRVAIISHGHEADAPPAQ